MMVEVTNVDSRFKKFNVNVFCVCAVKITTTGNWTFGFTGSSHCLYVTSMFFYINGGIFGHI